jgi:hypothetical protein
MNRQGNARLSTSTFLLTVFFYAGSVVAGQDGTRSSDANQPAQDASSGASSSNPLKWPAPSLVDPVTITLAAGQTSTVLDPKIDYIVKLPAEKKVGATELIGGHHVVIIGGHVTVPGDEPQKEPKISHFAAFHLKHQTGTVHIEGVLIDNSAGGSGWDAFFTNCPKAIVQIQNVRVEGLSGTFKGHHADICQIGHGVGELRIDRLTGTSDYQGLFLKIEENLRGKKRFGDMKFSRINLIAIPGTSNQALLYLTTPDFYMEGDVYLEDVYLKPAPNYSVNYIVPRVSPCGLEQMRTGKCDPHFAWKDGAKISWPFFENVHGSIVEGTPEEDFAPAGTVGVGYVPAVQDRRAGSVSAKER